MSSQSPQLIKSMLAYSEIYEEYAENAAFLWLLRSQAVSDPSYDRNDLKELEHRIDAQLEGLMLCLEISWQLCVKSLEYEEAGEVFSVAILAFRSQDVEKIKIAVTAGLTNSDTFKGLVSAMGWLPSELIKPWIIKFLNSKDIDHKYLAISVCSIRTENPGDILDILLQRQDCLEHDKLHSRILRLIGELRLYHYQYAVHAEKQSKNNTIAFWANWSAVLLGDTEAIENLKIYCLTTGCFQGHALQLVMRVLTIENSRNFITEMMKDETLIRAVIKAVGILGDPYVVNWLIALMEQPQLARVSGESFTFITGLNLEKENLHIEDLPDSEAKPNDNSNDPDVEMDADEELDWPDKLKVEKKWQQIQKDFNHGQRYFLGQPITSQVLNSVLLEGTQRQRLSASIEIALLNSKDPLVNIKQKHINYRDEK